MKQFVLLTLLLGLTQQGFAQDKRDVAFGLKAGANLTNISFSAEGFDSRYRLAYHAGVYGQTEFAKRFLFSPELLLSVKGYRAEESFGLAAIQLSFYLL